MLAENLQDVREQTHSGAKEQKAALVEAGRRWIAKVGHVAPDHPKSDDAEGQIHEEDDAPGEPMDDEAAGEGTDEWPDERRDDDKLHGSHELGAGERAHQGEP